MNPLPSKAPEVARRVVIVVPRRDMELYAYLKRSFSEAANVEVVLDRRERRVSGGALTPTPDLRRPSAGRSIVGGVLLASSEPPRAAWAPPRPKTPR